MKLGGGAYFTGKRCALGPHYYEGSVPAVPSPAT